MRAIFMTILYCVLLGAGLSACGEQPKETQPKEVPAKEKAQPEMTTAEQLLDAAIEAAGGLAKLKAASSWTSKSKGSYMGMPYESNNTYRGGIVRMDVSSPGGEKMSMTMGPDQCWMTSGPVVIPCSGEEKKESKVNSTMGQAMLLWPLKEAGWKLSKGEPIDINGKRCDVLEIKNPTIGVEGELIFDSETHLLVYAKHGSKMHGRPVQYASELADHKEFCGVKMATKWQTTMDGQPYVDEEILELTCTAVEDSAFEPPEQVKDGTVVERTVQPFTGACHLMSGPYDGAGAAIGKLMGFMGQEQLMPMGAPMMIYLKAPPQVKKPEKFETEICFPVGAPPPAEPTVKGEFSIKGFAATKVLAIYGVGPYDKKSEELAKLIAEEVGKRKLEPTGPMRQFTYSDPENVPAEQLVSEMQFPI